MGLRPTIRNWVELQPCWTLASVVQLAMKVESQQTRSNNRQNQMDRGQVQIGAYNGQGGSTQKIETGPSSSGPAPYSQGRGQNRGSGTPNFNPGGRDITSKYVGEKMKCYKCGKEGHKSAECRKKNANLLVNEEVEDFEAAYENGVNINEENLLEFTEDEVLYDDKDLPALVVRRAMLAPKAIEAKPQRNNIFRTRYSAHGRLCNVIIDGGSCENFVSKEMVTKLNLVMQPHPKPYKVVWFKKGGEVKVTHQCLVPFSIGKNYSDKVLCDVVDMEACHILLGRPWQYDNKTVHLGEKNIYAFYKDGVKVVLAQ